MNFMAELADSPAKVSQQLLFTSIYIISFPYISPL